MKKDVVCGGTLLLIVVGVASCFAPNPSVEAGGTEQGTTAAASGSDADGTDATGTTTTTTEPTSGPVTAGSASSGSGTLDESGEPPDETGEVVVVNALLGGVAFEVCVGEATDLCSGPLSPGESTILAGIPTGETLVALVAEDGQQESQLMVLGSEGGFSAVVAAGASSDEMDVEIEAASISAEQKSLREQIIVNAIQGTPTVTLGDAGEIPVWSSALRAEGGNRVVAEIGGVTRGVTSESNEDPWAVLLIGDAAAAPGVEDSVSGLFVDEAVEQQFEDAAATFVAPRFEALEGQNVICAGDQVLASNVFGVQLEGPFPIPPYATAVSLREGDDCMGKIYASDDFQLGRQERYLVSFGSSNSVVAYEDTFSPSSPATEYRVLNFLSSGDSVWLHLVDDQTDEFIETLAAGVGPNGESSSFSLDASDAGDNGDYFLGTAFSADASGAEAEISWPHSAGARVWFIVQGNAFSGVDVGSWPWERQEG